MKVDIIFVLLISIRTLLITVWAIGRKRRRILDVEGICTGF